MNKCIDQKPEILTNNLCKLEIIWNIGKFPKNKTRKHEAINIHKSGDFLQQDWAFTQSMDNSLHNGWEENKVRLGLYRVCNS